MCTTRQKIPKIIPQGFEKRGSCSFFPNHQSQKPHSHISSTKASFIFSTSLARHPIRLGPNLPRLMPTHPSTQFTHNLIPILNSSLPKWFPQSATLHLEPSTSRTPELFVVRATPSPLETVRDRRHGAVCEHNALSGGAWAP